MFYEFFSSMLSFNLSLLFFDVIISSVFLGRFIMAPHLADCHFNIIGQIIQHVSHRFSVAYMTSYDRVIALNQL